MMVGRGSLSTLFVGIISLGIALILSDGGAAKGPANFMMSTTVDGHAIEGQPLYWNREIMCLLSRDGAMHVFANQDAQQSRKIERRFYPLKSTEMKNQLREEFGRSFDVSSSEHFVVVHPKGVGSVWAERMETLYRTFMSSMRVRGISTHRPRVIMVAVVFRNRGHYYSYFAKQGTPLSQGIVGHYEHASNRVFLYEDGGSPENLETVIHEATHQTAYNVGVHQRLTEQPKWLVEGLAMMFETPGMRESWSVQSRSSRINRYRLDSFRDYLERRPKDALLKLIAGDQRFRTSTLDAYAEAWLLSFYLFETRSQDYSRYLARVAARPAFSAYPAQSRVADFTDAFGNELSVLENQMLRFAGEL